MSKNQNLAAQIIEQAGGAKNIKSITNCATRLRMYVKDPDKFNQEGMKKIQGVMGVQLSGSQHQVIVGPTAIHLCKEIQDEFGIAAAGGGQKQEKATGNVWNRFLETVSGCIAPLVPALAASGFIKVILTILTMMNLLSDQGQTYMLLNTASDAVFYFMPMILAYTSAKRFQCNEVLAIVVAGLLLHPNFISLVTASQEAGAAIHLFGLPVTLTSYNGTVVPVILTVWVMSYVEKLIDRFLPKVITHLFRPLLIVLFMAPIALVVTGPAGAIIGEGIAVVLQGIFAKAGWLALALSLLGAAFLCMTGMHLALIPIAMTSISETGYDEFVLVMFLCFTLSQGAAALAVLLKTKNSNLRQIAIPAAISGLFGGTSEPALYGISVKMKKPLYATMIGSTAAGIYAGLVHLKVFAFGLYSILGLPGYYSEQYTSNLQHAFITSAIAVFGTMIAVWVLGFDDSIYEEEAEDESKEKTEKKSNKKSDEKSDKKEEHTLPNIKSNCEEKAEIVSVTSGMVVPMDQIEDEVFSAGVIGEAIGVISEDGICYSPVNGVIASIFQTKHAIGIKGEDGIEVLIHVGIDSVNLDGEGFKVFVKTGDTVKAGQKLLTYEKEVFKKHQINETTVLVVSNSQEYKQVRPLSNGGKMKAGDPIMEVLV